MRLEGHIGGDESLCSSLISLKDNSNPKPLGWSGPENLNQNNTLLVLTVKYKHQTCVANSETKLVKHISIIQRWQLQSSWYPTTTRCLFNSMYVNFHFAVKQWLFMHAMTDINYCQSCVSVWKFTVEGHVCKCENVHMHCCTGLWEFYCTSSLSNYFKNCILFLCEI